MDPIRLIKLFADADEDRQAAAEKALKGEQEPKRLPGTVKQAAQILQCCTRTVARYADKGLLHRIRLSQRKVRYDLAECQRLAENGAGESL